MKNITEDRIKTLENGLLDRMNDHKTPGMSIAVINDHRIEWAKGYGVCELGTENRVNENTIFQAGSVSKTVFSFAVMRLVQDGIINLDEDIHTYLKSWQVPETVDKWRPVVTMRQLLSHTAGFTQIGFAGYKKTEEIPDILQILNGEPPSNTKPIMVDIIPGLQYRYSGGGFTVAQVVITDILGIPFAQFMEERVFRPIGMANSCYEHPLSKEKETRAASGYRWNYRPVEGGWVHMPFYTAAGLWTTPVDLAKFGLELQKALQGESYNLRKDYAVEMTTPQVENHYGLGIRIKGDGLTKQVYHFGGNQGFHAVLMLYKNLGLGASIMINSWHAELIDEVLLQIADTYDWPDFMLRQSLQTKIPVKEILGYYIFESGIKAEITVNADGFLSCKYGSQNPKMMSEITDNQYLLRPLNTEVEFEKNPISGEIQLTLAQDFKKYIARKQP